MDQLREGLQTLDFGARLSVLPDVFKEVFVAGDDITAKKVKKCLVFPAELSDEESSIKVYLEEYLMTATCESLEDLLIFATVAACLPAILVWGESKLSSRRSHQFFLQLALRYYNWLKWSQK